ncbi:MAG TPA: methyltransferase [Actinophytocola sp.]|nr:methyltransferase [Actinophytocola sp.]
MTERPLADVSALFQIYAHGVAWHCVCAVTRLGIPDLLADGPLQVAKLAAAAGTDADALRRVLRLLAGHGIVRLGTADDPDVVALADGGRPLLTGHPLSVRATFATLGISDVAHRLTDVLRTGRAAAPEVLGAGFWEYLAARPSAQEVFADAMVEQAHFLTLPCVPLLDWPGEGTVVDVGGGAGVLLAEVLAWAPDARGVLVDRPAVFDRAGRYLAERGVADRAAFVPGDLFEPPPAGELYLLARVLHNWADEPAATVLTAVATSAPPGACLRIFEDPLPEGGGAAGDWSDVSMLALYPGARERTEREYRDLLAATGWRFERTVAGPPGMSVLEATRRDDR